MAIFALNQAGFSKSLEDKPRDWVQAIAVRCALRVLPFALDTVISSSSHYDPGATKSLLLLMALSSGAARVSPLNRDIAFHNAAEWAYYCYVGTYQAFHFIRIANAARSSTIAARFSDVNDGVVHAISNALYDYDDSTAALQPMLDDINLLKTLESGTKLLAAPLWPQEQPEWFDAQWARASKWLEDAPEGFAWWRPWYEAKLRGAPYEFPAFDEAAEREFFARLLAKDNDWWVLDAAPANAEVAGWVAELSRPEKAGSVDFFISYSTANEAAAREVAGVLDDLGKTYIVQFRDFAQQNFVTAMNNGLAQSERLIALYSSEYMASDHCNAEWNVFYNRDPSSVQRKIVAFKLDDADLKPLMLPIVYRDLSRLNATARKAAIREWIVWEPPVSTRAHVEQVVTATHSPRIVETDEGKLDIQPNPAIDQPEYPPELAEAIRALRMVFDVVLEDMGNLPRAMRSALVSYDTEFTENGGKSAWGGLDRLMVIVAGGLIRMPAEEFSHGQKEALEQLIAAHGVCMAALKNADKEMRELAAIPIEGADQTSISDLVGRLNDFFRPLREMGLTSNRLDRHVDDLVEQGRDFAFEAGQPDSNHWPHARRRYLLYVGGFGLATLDVLGSLASISSVSLVQEAIAAGQMMVEAFFRMVGL